LIMLEYSDYNRPAKDVVSELIFDEKFGRLGEPDRRRPVWRHSRRGRVG
jgi:hypothetical protein